MSRSTVLPLVFLLAGCGGNADLPDDNPAAGNDAGSDGGGGSDTGTVASTVCSAKVSLTPAAPIFEIGSRVAFPVALLLEDGGGAAGNHPIKLELLKDGAPIKTLKDGPEPLGKLVESFSVADLPAVAPGKYTLRATLGCPSSATSKTEATAQADVWFARLGAIRVDVGAGDGARVPLMYHAVNNVSGNSFPISDKIAASSIDVPTGQADLDDTTGAPRTFPDAPWAELATPKVDSSGAVVEEGVTYPVSLKVGTKPDLTFTFGKTAKGGVAALPTGAPSVRLVVDGTSPSAAIADKATVRLEASPVAAVNRVDLPLKWHFEAQATDGWKAIPGAEQTVTLRLYGVLGNEMGSTAPNLPWVAVVDAATVKVAGKAADAVAVRKILVQMVYEEFGLKYDRKSGASFYTNYTTGYAGARFDLTSFLKRSKGSTVNCTDCASILSTYANMVGSKLHYAIIGSNFSLNPIMGIGSSVFGSPFDSGRFSFSYHAVTTPDATKTIDDATLALDGDTDPKVAPQTKLLVQDVTGSEYLTRLSPGAPEYKYVDEATTVR